MFNQEKPVTHKTTNQLLFQQMVNNRIETMTALDGKIYLSADDICKLIEHMGKVSKEIVKTAPHPMIALQMETLGTGLEKVAEIIRSTANQEKSKQPSRN